MALGATLDSGFIITDHDRLSQPMQIPSFWNLVIENAKTGGNSGTFITNPNSTITDSGNHILNCNAGTSVRIIARYTASATLSTDPIIQVFGRTVANTSAGTPTAGPWTSLYNKAGALELTLADSASDTNDGTFEYTLADPDANTFDLDGNNQILVGLKTAAAGPTDVDILAKVI
jgi:hypothetical protein